MIQDKNKILLKKLPAITLIELIIVIIILPMIVFGAYTFMDYSIETGSEQEKEVNIQHEVRDAMIALDEKIKYSKSVYTISKEKFQGGSVEPKWQEFECIGVATEGPNKGEICQFKYKKPNWTVEKVFTDPNDDVTYEITLEISEYSNTGSSDFYKCVGYTLTPIISGVKKPNRALSSVNNVVNAYYGGDNSINGSPSIALAYIEDDTSTTTVTTGGGGGKVQIVFVLCTSADMEKDYAGTGGAAGKKDYPNGKQVDDVTWQSAWGKTWPRIHDTRYNAYKMVKAIKNSGLDAEIAGVDVRAVARSFNFTNPSNTDTYGFANINTDYSAIVSFICEPYYIYDHSNLYDNNQMSIIQGNNDGDGLRVGYNLFDPNAKKYLIFITSDATPAYRTLKSGIDNDYYYGKGMFFNISDNRDLDSGGFLKWSYRPPYCYSTFARLVQEPRTGYQNKEYPLKVAEHFKNKYPSDLKSFIVTPGYRKGDGKWETNYFMSINAAMGNTDDDFFDASNASEFEAAMNKITQTIVHIDNRFFEGP